MNKKQRQLYESGIKEIAESLLIDAHKKAFDITENVFVDILVVRSIGQMETVSKTVRGKIGEMR